MMADVLDLPPEPIPRDERRREKPADREQQQDRSAEDRKRDPRLQQQQQQQNRREDRPLGRDDLRRDFPEKRAPDGPLGRDELRRDFPEKRAPDGPLGRDELRRDFPEKRALDGPLGRDDLRRDFPEKRAPDGDAADRGDRERDYKRRKSPSRDRDRRYSPSAKRSRRDDDDDAGGRRGGSPWTPADDFARPSGHDRRLGGSSGRLSSYNGDERRHIRHLGPRPGSGRPNINDESYKHGGSSRREGLKTYKQFISELEDDVLPAEAQRRYEEYKNGYITTQKRNFFDRNKNEDWLREKYDPAQLEIVIQRRNESCRESAKGFIAELEGGYLDFGPGASGKSMQDTEHDASEEEAGIAAKRKKPGRGHPKGPKGDTAPKAPAVSSDPKRIASDIEQAQLLIRKLDHEKGIEGNLLAASDQQGELEKSVSGVMIDPIVIVRGANFVKGYEGVELLDVLLTYLWRIHGVDYYGMVERKEPPKGFRHVRSEGTSGDDSTPAAEWEKKVDETWQARLQCQDPLEIMLCKDKVETLLSKSMEQYIRRIKDEKYGWKFGCGANGCTKVFHGPEFVHKHLKLKHSEIVNDSLSKAREELYFDNYMSDPDAPGGIPVMCHSGPVVTSKGASNRASRGIERQDRGNRDSERYERVRDEERFERGERSRSQDYGQDSPSYSGGAHDVEGSSGQYEGRSEMAAYDQYNGHRTRGAPPLSSDVSIPPPVLMPVPGAGPLGPFVPAPPEVAMRLIRQQGGLPFHPGSYDGEASGGSRGRKGRQSDAPPMILPLPGFRQDPRHLRSYHDLDAPEDEVSVIDYRSL